MVVKQVIKDFVSMTVFITAVGVVLKYIGILAVSFAFWELPDFYWSWEAFRGIVLGGVFIGVWFAIDQIIDRGEKAGEE